MVIFKNFATFTDFLREINNTKIDNAKDIDTVMLMYDLIEHSDNYSKIPGSLWHYCKDKPAVDNKGATIAFNAANVTDLFSFK